MIPWWISIPPCPRGDHKLLRGTGHINKIRVLLIIMNIHNAEQLLHQGQSRRVSTRGQHTHHIPSLPASAERTRKWEDKNKVAGEYQGTNFRFLNTPFWPHGAPRAPPHNGFCVKATDMPLTATVHSRNPPPLSYAYSFIPTTFCSSIFRIPLKDNISSTTNLLSLETSCGCKEGMHFNKCEQFIRPVTLLIYIYLQREMILVPTCMHSNRDWKCNLLKGRNF